MRKLLIALVVLLASVGAALWLRENGGFVILTVGNWTIQASLLVFVAAVAALYLVLMAIFGTLRRVRRTPERVRRWQQRRRARRARGDVVGGLVRIAEGHYHEAERMLLNRAAMADVPLLNYLLAAVAAQRRGSWAERDEYLARAERSDTRARLAVGVLQAQLQLEARQWEQALATLNWLRDEAPANRRALMLLAECLTALTDWERLAELLPELRRRQALGERELSALETRVAHERLEAAARADDPAGLKDVWQSLPKERRREPEMLALYARRLNAMDRAVEAEQLLRQRLSRRWEPMLVAVYGELTIQPAEPAFAQTEKWLREHPEDPALLYAAGAQAMRAELWGRARSYLEAAAARDGRPEIQRLLGALYERLGENDRAREAYRRALERSFGPLTSPVLDMPEAPKAVEASGSS